MNIINGNYRTFYGSLTPWLSISLSLSLSQLLSIMYGTNLRREIKRLCCVSGWVGVGGCGRDIGMQGMRSTHPLHEILPKLIISD